MREARDHHCCDVRQYEGNRYIREDIVHVLKTFGGFFADDAWKEAPPDAPRRTRSFP